MLWCLHASSSSSLVAMLDTKEASKDALSKRKRNLEQIPCAKLLCMTLGKCASTCADTDGNLAGQNSISVALVPSKYIRSLNQRRR